MSLAVAQKPPKPVVAAEAAVAAEKIATDKIKDLKAILRINHEETDFDELKKIGGSFATSYRIPKYDVYYKWPNKARFEAKVLGAGALMVYNGDKKMFRIPLRTEVQNIHGKPGQKQSLLDMGVFARDWLELDYQATFVRREGKQLVYRLTERDSENKSFEMVWVNPKTAIMEKRQSFNGWANNRLVKELRYLNPVQPVPGVYVPTRIEIYNQYGNLGGVQDVESISVNRGLDDGLFAIAS